MKRPRENRRFSSAGGRAPKAHAFGTRPFALSLFPALRQGIYAQAVALALHHEALLREGLEEARGLRALEVEAALQMLRQEVVVRGEILSRVSARVVQRGGTRLIGTALHEARVVAHGGQEPAVGGEVNALHGHVTPVVGLALEHRPCEARHDAEGADAVEVDGVAGAELADEVVLEPSQHTGNVGRREGALMRERVNDFLGGAMLRIRNARVQRRGVVLRPRIARRAVGIKLDGSRKSVIHSALGIN